MDSKYYKLEISESHIYSPLSFWRGPINRVASGRRAPRGARPPLWRLGRGTRGGGRVASRAGAPAGGRGGLARALALSRLFSIAPAAGRGAGRCLDMALPVGLFCCGCLTMKGVCYIHSSATAASPCCRTGVGKPPASRVPPLSSPSLPRRAGGPTEAGRRRQRRCSPPSRAVGRLQRMQAPRCAAGGPGCLRLRGP